MTQTTQTEAQRLAEKLEEYVQAHPQTTDDEAGGYCSEQDQIMDFAALELRRLDAAEQTHLRELRAYRTTVENLEKRIAELEMRTR